VGVREAIYFIDDKRATPPNPIIPKLDKTPTPHLKFLPQKVSNSNLPKILIEF
jgi:hypothetical protein